jgi:hypothetical protein
LPHEQPSYRFFDFFLLIPSPMKTRYFGHPNFHKRCPGKYESLYRISSTVCHLQQCKMKEKCLKWRRVFLFSGLKIQSQFDLWKTVEAFQRCRGIRTCGNLGTLYNSKPLESCRHSGMMKILLKRSAFGFLAPAKLHVVNSLYF